MRFLVASVFLYACESWTLTAELQRRKEAMEMSCCCKILCISYKDHATNKDVHAKIQQAIGPHENLLTTVKRCKQQWYGHVSSSSGLAKPSCKAQWKGEELKRQGRERKKWEDNVIREWTGLEFAKSQRAVENREKWRKLVAKSSVVPQWPSWLRSRWDERWERVWTQMDMCFTQSLVMVFNVKWGVQTLSQLTFLSAGFIWCGWPLGDGRFCHVVRNYKSAECYYSTSTSTCVTSSAH